MNWYYAAGGQQQGPVDDAQLDALIQAGTVTQDTLIWREGMANWQPLRQARPTPGGSPALPAPPMAAPPIAGGAAGEVVCAECGKLFTRDNAIQYGTAWVCAACKPVFLQKLREGAQTGGAQTGQTGVYVDPELLMSQVFARGCAVDIGSCMGRSWDLMKANFWLVVGATFVIHLCQGAAGAIPLLGYCAGPVLQGPLMGGLYLLYLKLARGENAEFGESFSGFSNFVQLMLASVVMSVVQLVCFIPAGIAFAFAAQSRNQAFMVGAVILGLVAVPFLIYVLVSWIFAFLLMVDKKYEFWTAMNVSRKVVGQCWWSMFALLFVMVLIQFLGFLALCVGVFVTITLLYGAIVFAYRDLFEGRGPAAS